MTNITFSAWNSQLGWNAVKQTPLQKKKIFFFRIVSPMFYDYARASVYIRCSL